MNRLAQEWLQRADDAGVMLLAWGGEVWIGTVMRGAPQHRIETFRAALNADPQGKAALLLVLSPEETSHA